MGRVVGSENQERVLLLGAGMVSGPVVKYLSKDPKIAITVASAVTEEVEKMRTNPSVDTAVIDVASDSHGLEQLIKSHDIVISLLPYTLHPQVARLAIKNQTNMVTSSYLSPAMQELHKPAEQAGITVMNEVGLDPGIDHLLAMECIDQVHHKGGKIRSFVSYCGGLPAPENSENPLRYKFSWSPKGVLMALNNPAKYLLDGQVVEVGPNGGVLDAVAPIDFMPGYSLVGYPNRDSTIYSKLYGIQNEVRTILRGTLRYTGFVEAVKALRELGLLSGDPVPYLDPNMGPDLNWKQATAQLLHQREDIFEGSLKSLVQQKFGDNSVEFKAIEKERDMVILRHDIGIEWPNGDKEIQHVDLVRYGAEEGRAEGFSAMAETVGYTAAITAKMILTDEIQRRGMVLPLTQDIYRPILKRLGDLGIKARTHTTTLV